jgi:type I restriction enzyme, S subunit
VTGLSVYPAYRKSPAAWIPLVPSEWSVLPFHAVFTESRHPNTGMTESNLLSLSYGRIVRRSITVSEGLLPESFETYQIVEPGDIVFRFTDLQNDQRSLRSALVRERGIITSAYLAAKPRGIAPDFAAYLMRSYDTAKVFYGMGGGIRQSLRFTEIRRLPVLVPSREEQQAIVRFLDRETAKIDTLIAKQEQLIEILQERWSSELGAATAKDPEGRWPVVPLRRFIRYLTSGSRGWADYYADEGERFVRIGNLPRGHLNLRGEVQFVNLPPGATEGSRSRLQRDDLVLSITAYLGSVAVVDEDWIDAYVSQHVALCRIDTSRLCPRFAGYFLLSDGGQQQLKQVAAGGTKQGLALDDIKDLMIPVPSMPEQKGIVDDLDTRRLRLNHLISKVKELNDFAAERRVALITAAVTGQIDVREQVA